MKRPARSCPTCGSLKRLKRNVDVTRANEEVEELRLCRNSWHPAQAFPVPPEAVHMTPTCGSHCGVKDGLAGHCDCRDCHNGKREAEGLPDMYSIDGKSVKGVNPS